MIPDIQKTMKKDELTPPTTMIEEIKINDKETLQKECCDKCFKWGKKYGEYEYPCHNTSCECHLLEEILKEVGMWIYKFADYANCDRSCLRFKKLGEECNDSLSEKLKAYGDARAKKVETDWETAVQHNTDEETAKRIFNACGRFKIPSKP